MILGVTDKEQRIIEGILDAYADSYSFYYYGSRVKGNYAANYSPLLCTQLTENLAKPLSSVLYDLLLWRSKAESYRLYGSNYCNGQDRQCLSQTPLTAIHQYCSNCNSEGSCSFTLEI